LKTREIDAMKFQQQRLCVGTVLAMTMLASAHAQDARAVQVKSLAATCASCHGTNGKAVEGAVVPGLAGVPAVHMVEQMKAFRAGARQATVMHQIVKGYTDAQIEQLATHFAAQPK
jgi:cytochrome subunit of sulfide dehydrogenase